MNHTPIVIFIIGVSGSGKSTIGKLLAEKLQFVFKDADDYHPPANVDKMSRGIPLEDEDRKGWLNEINNYLSQKVDNHVFACSALKEKYRMQLQKDLNHQVHWVLLDGSFELILSRMKARNNHFMPSSLLKSQFETLEIPEMAFRVDISLPPEEMIQQILDYLPFT